MAISDRITSIEEHIKESYQELEGIGIDTTGVNNNLENIPKLIDGYWETLPKVTGEGTSITLDNTKEGKMKINLKGNTSQETTTGKNLANIYVIPNQTSNLTLTIANDKITISNNSSTSGYVSLGIKLQDLCPTLKEGDVVYLFFDNTSSSTLKDRINVNGDWFTNASKTITQAMLNAYVIMFGGYNETAIISNFMITKVNDSTYEPYTNGASPNPDYPQDIHVVSGDNSIVVCGKNLLDTSILVEANADKTYTNSGFWGYKLSDELTTFTLSRENNTMYANAGYLTIGQGNTINEAFSSKSWLMHPSVQGLNAKSKTLTNTGELWLFVGNTQEKINTTLEYAGYFQLEKGTQATTYEAYKGASYPISLGDIELCKIGDYQDSIVKDNGKWYLKKEIGSKLLTTSDYSNILSSYSNLDYVAIKKPSDSANRGNSNNIPITYTKGTYAYITNFNSLGNLNKITSSGGYNLFYLGVTKGITTEQAQNIVNGSLLYYPLATPTYTEITDSTLLSQLEALEKARSYTSQTNISQNNNDLASILNATALEEM